MSKDQHGSRMLEQGENDDVIYTEFEKGYKKVCHTKLQENMKVMYGITGKLTIWLIKFFEERKQLVLIEETKSEESEVIS